MMRIVFRRMGLFGLLLLVSGCGAGRGSVSGSVSFRNQALTGGTVLLFTEGGEVYSALIGADGAYCLADVPAGAARLAVVSHGEVPPGLQVRPPTAHPPYPGQAAAAPSRKALPIPQRYHDPDQAGLTYQVTHGAQTFDIVLRP